MEQAVEHVLTVINGKGFPFPSLRMYTALVLTLAIINTSKGRLCQ